MPDYEFYCHACKKTFSKVLTLAEYEEGEVLCPHCSSDNAEQSWRVARPIAKRRAGMFHRGNIRPAAMFSRHSPITADQPNLP